MKRTQWALAAAVAALGVSASQGQDAPVDTAALFQKLDKNGDGKLTADEIPGDQARFFARLVRKGDKNSDGALTREEFDQASKPEERPNVPLAPGGGGDQGRGDARQRFEMLDRNKNGKLTADELPEPVRDRMKPLFDRIGKQEITLEEFMRFGQGPGANFRPDPAELFKRLDTNGDGKLTKDEIPAELKERFAGMFERLKKNEFTKDEFVQSMERLREAMGGRPMGNPEEMFARLDTNGDGKLTIDEAPERMRPLVEAALRRAGKEREGSLSKEEFARNAAPRDGERRPEGAPARGDAQRRPEGERPREGDRPAGDRAPEGRGPLLMRLLDTNRDGRLSKDELAKMSDVFDELDRNHDGQLDSSELIGPLPSEGRGQMREGGGGREGANRGDAPGRGDATQRGEGTPRAGGEGRSERDAPARQRPDSAATGAGQPGPFFQRLDRDGDGKISKDEAPEQMKDRFSVFDTNGDGFISLEEFRSGAAGLFGDRPANRQPQGRPEPAPKRD